MNQRSIIFEETVKIQHRIVVNYEDEEELNKAIFSTDDCKNLDDCIEAIGEILEICQVDENWTEDLDDFEYYDDYPTELDN